jgi:uncharacterized membrane protein YeaQ/YmgE (transglycosylase-associated protein family)
VTLIDFLVLLLIAGICGAIGQSITGYSHGGCLVAIAVGFIGALLGGFLSRKLGLPELIVVRGFPVIWSIIGAALFVAAISLISGRRTVRL